jgi:hypothetical protein
LNFGEDTQKPLWQEEKTCSMGNGCNKGLPSFEPPLQQPPHEKELLFIPSLLEWGQQ